MHTFYTYIIKYIWNALHGTVTSMYLEDIRIIQYCIYSGGSLLLSVSSHMYECSIKITCIATFQEQGRINNVTVAYVCL